MENVNVIDMNKNNPWMDVEVYLWVRGCLPDDDNWYEYTQKSLFEDFINMK